MKILIITTLRAETYRGDALQAAHPAAECAACCFAHLSSAQRGLLPDMQPSATPFMLPFVLLCALRAKVHGILIVTEQARFRLLPYWCSRGVLANALSLWAGCPASVHSGQCSHALTIWRGSGLIPCTFSPCAGCSGNWTLRSDP